MSNATPVVSPGTCLVTDAAFRALHAQRVPPKLAFDAHLLPSQAMTLNQHIQRLHALCTDRPVITHLRCKARSLLFADVLLPVVSDPARATTTLMLTHELTD